MGSCSFFLELHSITIYFVPDFTPFIGLFWTSWNIAIPTLSLSAHHFLLIHMYLKNPLKNPVRSTISDQKLISIVDVWHKKLIEFVNKI